MFKFPVKTEEEIQALNLIEEGAYQFEVIDVEDGLESKNGNAMIKLKIKLWDIKGHERIIFDYLVSIESMVYKIKHFCESIGFGEDYQLGCFEPKKTIGKMGNLQLGIQKGNGSYPARNSVKDYLPQSEKKASSEDVFNDDIPF